MRKDTSINDYPIHKNGYLQCPECGELEEFNVYEVTEDINYYDIKNNEWYLRDVDSCREKGEIECWKCRYREEIHRIDFDLKEIKLKEWIKKEG